MQGVEVDKDTKFLWGSNEFTVDVRKSIARSMKENTLSQDFQIENNFLGCDPSFGIGKQLTIHHSKGNTVLNEHETVNFQFTQPLEIIFPISKPKIYIYFHICQIGIWKTVVIEIFNLIVTSGLLQVVDELCLGVLGTDMESIREIFGSEPKVRIVMVGFDNSVYERATLRCLHERARLEECRILYLHSKGVTHPEWARERIKAWTDYMCYWAIERWQTCLRVLEFSDTVGTEWLADHYRGNFWWANSDYLKTLSSSIGPNYTDPEYWIGTGTKGTIFNFMCSNMYPYHHVIPKESYCGKDQDPTFIYGQIIWLPQKQTTSCVVHRTTGQLK